MAKQVKAQPTEPRWRDLREWLDVVEGLGELKRVQGANSEEDIGAVTEMLDHAEESPSVLFDEIPNFKPGYRVLVNTMGSRKRQAVTLGLDPAEASHDRLLQFWRELLKGFAPIPPINVKRGSVQQNILRDDEADLERFPVPIWHPLDGGRFIGTASVNIMRDPDTGIINAGTYRNQVFDRNRIGIRAAPPHHGGIIKEQYLQRGELCPGMIWAELDEAGVPGVCGVWIPPDGGNRLMTVVALKTQYLGHGKQAGLIASQCAGGIEMNRLTVVVEDHVDVTNIQDVVWAILARCDPERGVEIIKDTKGSRIDMAIAPDKRELNANSRMIIDATTPFEWKNHPLAGNIIRTPH